MVNKRTLNSEDVQDIFSLTPVQEGMLFHYIKNQESNLYHIILSLRIAGKIDTERFKTAWQWVAKNNEMLRAVFRWKEVKNPVQIIKKDQGVQIRFYDYQEFIGRETETTQTIHNLEETPFTVDLYKLGEEEFKLVIQYHHILFDGWSIGIILREFLDSYEKLINNSINTTSVKVSFKEFVKCMRKRDQEKQELFWRNYLNGIEGKTNLSVRKIGENSYNIRNYKSTLPDSIKNKLELFSRHNDVTEASILYCAWGILIQRYNNSSDVVFGTTISGRSSNGEFEDIVGLFINTIPLRIIDNGSSCLELVKRIQKDLIERIEFENTSLPEIYKYTGIKSEEGLFDNIIVVENYPIDIRLTNNSHDLKILEYSLEEHPNFDLTVSIELFGDISINFIYNEDVFDATTIKSISRHFTNLLEAITDSPNKKASCVDMLSIEEKEHILYDFNKTNTPFSQEKTIYQLIEEQADKNPDRIAVIFENESLTYKQLNEKANQLARLLKKKNVGPEVMVGVCMERSFEMVIAMIGILKAGGAYVPFEPEYPEERLKFMVENSDICLMLTQQKFLEKLFFNKNDVEYLPLDSMWGEIDYYDTENLECQIGMNNAAYVIYTSGSTGLPKGAINTHRGMLNHKQWMQYSFSITESDRVLQKTPFCFDVSIWEFFWTLAYGACLVIAIPGGHKDPDYLIRTINEKNITIIHFVPSMLQLFLDRVKEMECKSLRMVFVSGEALSIDLQNRFFKYFDIPLHNVYGPAECADVSTFWTCRKDYSDSFVPIGTPISNVRIHILDKHMNVCSVGVVGEIYVTGCGVGKGYLNNAELTAEKFVSNPFEENTIAYRTGDLGRYHDDGIIEYCGRIDHQIKIRGQRVELSEIENVLLQHQNIKECIVDVKGKASDNRYIAGYIVTCDGKEIDSAELNAFLLKKLPSYMIPGRWVFMNAIPLLHNGKVDRSALPEPLLVQKEVSVEPKNRMEKIIATVWKEVLSLESVGVNSNFFDLGGNSLNIIRVNSLLVRELKREIPISVMFEYPTISSLASYLSNMYTEQAVSRVTGEENDNEKDMAKQESAESINIAGGVAIIGMAGRFPGAENIEKFWEILKEGKETITFFSDEELIEAGISAEQVKDSQYVKAKGILDQIEYFDADFFGYSPKEAEIMDPQLRILHECVYESLEDAAYNPFEYEKDIPLYLGASSNYYWINNISSNNKNSLDEFAAMILNEKDFFSTRIAYKLNLKGPCVTLQTACSTSMVCIDMAYQSILTGKYDMAIAGGAGITYPKKSGYIYHDGMIFSPDGHCRAFDDDAKGTVAGNGVGVVVLKNLEKAIQDGDAIYAVIKGSAVNNDGFRKVGFTAPSIEGQAEVIRDSINSAKVEPESIEYVEMHGTGTELGDVVEVEALKKAFNSQKRGFCRIGSVKTNMGHLDCASGITGFMKAALSIKNGLIPPSLNFNKPNRRIDFENSPFLVNTELYEWKSSEHPRRAGVSSFGIGGTNAHVILEEAPHIEDSSKARDCNLILLSAKSESSLQKLAINLREWIDKNSQCNVTDVAYTLQNGRKSYQFRKMLLCRDIEDMKSALDSLISKKVSASFVKEENRPIIFMFSGIGGQYVNMGLDLYRTERVFRDIIDKCADILKPLLGFDIKTILYPEGNIEEAAEKLKRPSINQPVIFIFEYALANLLMNWGIKPDAMIGYSFGEYTAACISGVFSLDEAVQLITYRGDMIEAAANGAMLSVPLTKGELEPILPEELDIAINNGPSCIVSGPYEIVSTFEKQMKNKRIVCMFLETSFAMHSRYMEPLAGKLKEKAMSINLKKPNIPYISNLSGTWIRVEEATNPEYWSKHLTHMMRFSDGMEQILQEGNHIFIEIGPKLELCTLARYFIKNTSENPVINTIRNELDEISDSYYLLNRLGKLWLYGKDINWVKYYEGEKRHRIHLPTYPFERKYYMPQGTIGFNSTAASESEKESSNRQKIDDWFYVPSWDRVPLKLHDSLSETESLNWLVFTDECGFAYKLAEYATGRVKNIVFVEKGKQFEICESNKYIINPENRNDYSLLFHQLCELGYVPNKIIHMWGVDKEYDEPNIARTVETLEEGYYSLLNIAQEIGDRGIEHTIDINVLTTNMHEVTGDEAISPQKSLVLGPCNVIPLEYTNINCKSIDIIVPDSGTEEEKNLIKSIYCEISTQSFEKCISYRGRYRWIQTFKPFPIPKQKSTPKLRQRGVYLITGGLGGIGLVHAHYLSQSVHATKLVLIGRTNFPSKCQWDDWIKTNGSEDATSKKIAKIREIEKSGTQVFIYSADTANREQMAKLVQDVENKVGSINGIIHAAGVPDGCMIQLRTKEMSQNVFAPKVMGTLVLNDIFKDRKLDFFVICSSLSSILSTFGQVAYCSANAFENAFAYYRNMREGGVTTSIDWDAWLEVGMATDAMKNLTHTLDTIETRPDSLLYDGILPSEGTEVFSRLMGCNISQAIISVKNLESVIKKSNEMGTTVSLEALKSSKERVVIKERPDLLTDYVAPISKIDTTIARVFEKYLGIEKVGINDNFFELGLTSLDIIRLSARLKEILNKDIPVVMMFKYPTISTLSKHVAVEDIGNSPSFKETNRKEQFLRGKRNLQNRREAKRGEKIERK